MNFSKIELYCIARHLKVGSLETMILLTKDRNNNPHKKILEDIRKEREQFINKNAIYVSEDYIPSCDSCKYCDKECLVTYYEDNKSEYLKNNVMVNIKRKLKEATGIDIEELITTF